MKIAAVVILYHPTEEALSNIRSYYDAVDALFVYDNTEAASNIKSSLLQQSKVQYHHDGSNKGIAKRLNEACELAMAQQYDWLLTMDQDSSFPEGSIGYYFACAKGYTEKENVAVFGTKNEDHSPQNSPTCQPALVNELITSASLINLALFTQIGRFDEQLFIDYVDYDYCYRAALLGYKIVRFDNIGIHHSLGTTVRRASIKTLFLIKKTKMVHSPLRCYYLYRNMLYLQEKFKSRDAQLAQRIRKDILTTIDRSILYGRQARQIKQYIELAKQDYAAGAMGKVKRTID